MCRSALEYPPNGKRCGKGQHLSPEQQKAHRDIQNAKRRANYAKKKAMNSESPVSAFGQVSENPAQRENKNLTAIQSMNVSSLTSMFEGDKLKEALSDEAYATQENYDLLMKFAETDTSSLHQAILGEDVAFNENNFSANSVHKLTLEDGTVGYFKPLRHESDTDFYDSYGVRLMQEVANEVSAYKFAQALGGDFARLVPETTVISYNGKFGTIQKEAVAHPEAWMDDPDDDILAHCAVFDYIAGSQDRHGGNFISVSPPREDRLIDNGFSFPEDVNPGGYGINVATFSERIDRTPPYKYPVIFEKVKELVESPDGLGMKEYLTPAAYDGMMQRAKHVLDQDKEAFQAFFNSGRSW